MSVAPASLPARWREARILLGGERRWQGAEVVGDERGLLLVAPNVDGPSLLALGEPDAVARLLADAVEARSDAASALARAGFVDRAHWLSLVRDVRPDDATLGALALTPFSTWDWFSTDVAPPVQPGEDAVRLLDRSAEAAAVRACLAAANPGTTADPEGADEAAWFGVDGPDGLVGVVGATRRGGRGGPTSWHLHGLGVRPEARGSGVGTALTAAATRAALDAGAGFVSLGMYADNHGARRIYERLGFHVEAELASYGPAQATHPPA